MSLTRSALVGVAVAQIAYVAFQLPTYQAAWGWSLTVPTNKGYSCSEGAKIGTETANKFECTVTAQSGYSCNVASSMVVCSDSTQGFTDSVPSNAANKCLTIGHKPGQPGNDNTSALALKPMPVCTATAGLKDIVATAQSTGTHRVLAEALTKANLVTALKGAGPFTVFAPTDAAMTAKLTELGITEDQFMNRADLANILKYHVISGSKIFAAQLQATQSPATLDGSKTVTITKSGGTVKYADATVTAADVQCSNGVIHVINKVVLPPGTTATTGTATTGTAVAGAKAAQSFSYVVFALLAVSSLLA